MCWVAHRGKKFEHFGFKNKCSMFFAHGVKNYAWHGSVRLQLESYKAENQPIDRPIQYKDDSSPNPSLNFTKFSVLVKFIRFSPHLRSSSEVPSCTSLGTRATVGCIACDSFEGSSQILEARSPTQRQHEFINAN